MSLKIFKQLIPISWACDWLSGEIDIEVYNVTRNRLIQTASTTTETYDFETSQ